MNGMKKRRLFFSARLLALCCALVVHFTVLAAPTGWTDVGNAVISANAGTLTSVGNDALGNTYVAYVDEVDGIVVKKFSGGSWSILGATGFTGFIPSYVRIAVTPSGTPYVMTGDDNPSYLKNVQVWTFAGSSWQQVGGVLGNAGEMPVIKADQTGRVYIAFASYMESGSGTRVYVAYFDGTNWQDISIAITDCMGFDFCGLAITATNDLYVSYKNIYGYMTSVQKYSGGAWTQVGPILSNSLYRDLGVDASGNVLVSQNINFDNSTTVSRFNSATNTWDQLGGGTAVYALTEVQCTAFSTDGTPYILFKDPLGVRAMVKRFNGTSWENVGNYLSIDKAKAMSMNATSDGIYVSLCDYNDGYKVSVKKFALTAPGPDVSDFSVLATHACVGNQSFVTINSSTLIPGKQYTVNYEVAGINTVPPTTSASFTFGAGSGNFTIPPSQLSMAGGNTVIIHYVTDVVDGTTSATLTSGNDANFPTVQNPNIYAVTGGGTYCDGGTGSVIGLTGSDNGVVYYLFNEGGSVDATPAFGGPLSFTPQTTAGSYSVVAMVPIFGCQSDMVGSVSVSALPVSGSFSMTGGGSYCPGGPGVAIGLSGSTFGVDYSLYNGATRVGIFAGTGSALDMGIRPAGAYTVVASDSTTCSVPMSGSAIVTLYPAPGPITGVTTVAVGATTMLSNSNSGGTWLSLSTGIATVNAVTGSVLGVAPGTSVIRYTTINECVTSTIVTVNPAVVTGNVVCVGQTVNLDNGGVPGGTWASAGSGLTVGATTGIATGVTAGSAVVYYFLPTGGFVTRTVTVKPLIATSGGGSVCQGQSITLANTTPGGGAWSAANTSIAVVNGSGVVTGVGGGMAVISFTTTGGCVATKTVTIGGAASFSGTGSICAGQNTIVVPSIAGGNWFAGTPAVATVSALGTVYGLATGAARITYVPATGCWSVATLTVNALTATTGVATLCQGQPATFANTTAGGGVWSSSNSNVATVSGAGVVTGAGSGTTTILFTTGSGCVSAKTVTVNPAAIISGSTIVCSGLSTALSNSTGGGTWSSSSITTASVSNVGLVTGVSGGTARISYSITGGCVTIATVTVNPLSAITGAASVCVGQTTALTNTTTGGGVWSSDNTNVATISNTGVLGGAGTGSAVISFRSAGGCVATKVVTVGAGAVLSGATAACTGQITTLSASLGGGAWSSSNPGYATVSASGIVGGVSAGTVRITYTSSGCQSVAMLTVSQLNATTGSAAMCQNVPVTLANTTAGGGTWSSANTSVATVSNAGVVYGVSGGSAVISFNATNGCVATKLVTLTASGSISGTASVCVGQQTILSTSQSGGNWFSGSDATATVSAAGVVSGVGAGVCGITYVVPSGCWSAIAVTVKALAPITGGIPGMCQSSTMSIANGMMGGGTWSSSNTTVATIQSSTSSSAVVKSAAPGTAIVSFTSSVNGCVASRTVLVNACREAAGEASVISEVVPAAIEVQLFPNPNNGMFTLSGLVDATEGQVVIEVVNMVGQVIYRTAANVQNGNIEQRIDLGSNVAAGNYILRLRTENSSKVFHFCMR